MALAGCANTRYSNVAATTNERECLARAMYFESNRSSDVGMLAVGTVVMNRLDSGKYGNSICKVVGAPRQFAPGVLTRPMNDRGKPRALANADAVLGGKRMPGLKRVMHFHTAGYSFPYRNMDYRVIAGGNAFYEKRNGTNLRRQSEVQVADLSVPRSTPMSVRPEPRRQYAAMVPQMSQPVVRTRPAQQPQMPPLAGDESPLPEQATGGAGSIPTVDVGASGGDQDNGTGVDMTSIY